MTEEKRKSMRFWFFMGTPLAVGILVFLVTVFPTASFGENTVRMFALERLSFDGRGFGGRVFGSHVLETKYGEITLNRFARVYSRDYRVITIIEAVNFTRGRASHNLVVEGITIPPNVRIILNSRTPQRVRFLEIAFPDRLVQYFQEIEVSGIPLRVGRVDFERQRTVADIVLDPIWPDYIELADTTVIGFLPTAVPNLHIYKEDALWRIGDGISVKLPGQLNLSNTGKSRSDHIGASLSEACGLSSKTTVPGSEREFAYNGEHNLFPLLRGVARNETVTDMRGTIWAERLNIVFVGGLSEQGRSAVASPQHIALAANASQAGARRAEILVEYAEDSGLLPLLIEHSFNWIRQRQPAPTKGDFFTDR